MPYKHFGRIGDVWKHLPLGEILKIEKPNKYIETNSAFPKYKIKEDWKIDYGIKWFIKNADELTETEYVRIEQEYLNRSEYLGSTGIAMDILGNSCKEYHFYDIEKDALLKNEEYADKLSLSNVFTHIGDSRTTPLDIIPKLNHKDFIHIDPYTILDTNSNGHSYSKLFESTLGNNIKSLLWYGYDNDKEKIKIRDWAENVIHSHKKNQIKLYEIEIVNLQNLPQELNPGIKGCGILIANLTQTSFDVVEKQFQLILKIYNKVEVKAGVNFKIKGFKI
ncbi:MAG TPA: hypothetical protein QF753_19830 [Victivallales bacterium]|nr:hypothetical protein [Victivallales bacterium]